MAKFDTSLHDKYTFTPHQKRVLNEMDRFFTADIKSRARNWKKSGLF